MTSTIGKIQQLCLILASRAFGSLALGSFVFSSLVVGNAASGAPADPASRPVPLEYFSRHDEFGGMKISPDGKFYAVLTGKYGRSQLGFIDIQRMKIVSALRSPERFEIDEFHWISDTRLIYTIAERQPGRVRPTPTGEIFAIDRDGKKQDFIYGYRAGKMSTGTRLPVREGTHATPELVSTLRNDDKHILIAEYPWRQRGDWWHFDPDAKPTLTLLNVYSGKKRDLGRVPLAGATVLVDREERVRFAIGRNEKLQDTVIWKPQPDSDWVAFEVPGFEPGSITPEIFGADNQSVLFSGVHTGKSRKALYRLDLSSQEVTELHAFENNDVAGVLLDFAQREAVGVLGYADSPLHHWIKPNDRAAQLYAALLKAFPENNVHITSTTADGRQAIVFVDSDVNPGDYYIFDTQKVTAAYLYPARQWIEPEQMRKREPIALQARDGLALHGYITRPAGEGPHPLIVLPHGGPHGIRDVWNFDWEAQLFANRGYAVLQLNFRGSGGYGLAFEEAGYREWGKRMQDDLTDATRWAIEQELADADRICIYGASYGGYAALMGAVREPRLYRCAIGYAGIYDLELMLSSADIPLSRSGRDYLHVALGNDVADLRERSPVHNAAKVEVPVLLIHGTVDGRADFEQAKRMKEALEKNGKKYEWLALRGEGHGVYEEETRHEVYQKVLDFLDMNLK